MGREFPILEFDSDKSAVIEPNKIFKKIDMPKNVVLCFFNDVIEKLRNEGKSKIIYNFQSEMGVNPLYEVEYLGRKVALFNPGIGAPLVAGMLEEAIAIGGANFIACGGAGVLDREIAVGHIIIPNCAIRDEGTSYHYLEPSREIMVNRKGIEAIERVLLRHNCKYVLAKTWTTDAFYRETVGKINQRRQEGCLTVEMECSAICAVAEYRNVTFAQILYGGDLVDCDDWDSRDWNNRIDIREKILWFAVESCLEL
jgi:purine-nucleoside phosphorylase